MDSTKNHNLDQKLQQIIELNSKSLKLRENLNFWSLFK